MQMIDQETKIIRRAVAGRGRVVSADLIAPRRAVWMFLERHKLDMSESVCDHVIGQQRGNLAITERSIVLFRNSPPRTEMHFVDRQRLAPGLSFLSFRNPCSIAKLVS